MKAKLQSDVKEAMKAKDQDRLETLRLLLTAVQYEEISKKIEPLPEAEILGIISKEIKKKKEEIDFAEKAGRNELVPRMKGQIAILESYLPKQMSRDELKLEALKIRGELSNPNVGSVMQALKERFSGKYDGKLASEVVKEVLV